MQRAAQPGDVIDSRYRITGVIGRGGMGQVYRAEHVTIQRPVALKLLHPGLGDKRAMSKRFEREAFAAGRVTHPNCVTVSDFGQLDDGTLYLVMELVEGETLGDVLDREGRVPWQRALRIARHVLLGLGHAHEQGVVHRDVKPDNIVVLERDGDADFAKVLDFGIAKLLGRASSETDKLTEAGTAIGTPTYFSPEQAFGETIDRRSDLYSAAVVLFEMIAGEPPFRAPDAIALVTKHAVADIPIVPNAPAAVVELVTRGLAKRPAERFDSAAAFIAAIDACLAAPAAAPGGQTHDETRSLRRTPMAFDATEAVTPVPVAPSTGPAVITPHPGPPHVAAGRLRRRWIYGGVGGLALVVVVTIAMAAGGTERKLEDLVKVLETAETCEQRRSAVFGLRQLGDERAIPALRRARHRSRGGVLGIGGSNANKCLKADAEAAIEHLKR